MKGTLVNTGTVLLGSTLGLLIGSSLPDRIKNMVMHALGLSTLLIGLRMAFKTENVLFVIGSLAIGGIIGELLKLEERLESLGEFIKRKIKSESSTFVLGFVTSSLVFCIGPMTIVGSIQDGVSGDVSLLYAKSLMDGFAAMIFASSLGVGVVFSSLTVLIIQGGVTILGSRLSFLLQPRVLDELVATGGLIIVGIGIYLLGIKKIKVGNFLPALVIVVFLALLFK
jgi:uncharacterized protein